MTTIHVAHSPDSDDAFMFYALAAGKIDTEGLTYVRSFRTLKRSIIAQCAVVEWPSRFTRRIS